MTGHGELWKHRPKLVQPVFHQRHHANYAAELATCIEIPAPPVRFIVARQSAAIITSTDAIY